METVGPVYIGPDKIDAILTYGPLLGAIQKGFALFSQSHHGEDIAAAAVEQPVRSVVMVQPVNGFLGCMPVYVGTEGLLVTKLVTFFPNNQSVPTHHAVIVVFNSTTGIPRAILDGETITTRRTAAASAVATKFLSNGTPKVLAILGSGVQAASHYEAFMFLFDLQEVRVWNHKAERAQAFVEVKGRGDKCAACKTVAEAVKEADVIITVTSSQFPVLTGQGLKPGVHINAVGACRPDWAELDPDLVRSSVIYVDSREAALKESGDILLAKAEVFAEIGEVINGTKKAFTERTTIFKSLGMAIEDAVAAKVVLDELGL